MAFQTSITIGNDSHEVEEDETNLNADSPNNDPVVGNVRKRVRGPTCMPKIWAQPEGERIKVLFNEFGQPIDKKTSSQLSHFMGSLARSGKYCPVHKPWHKVSDSKKQVLLDFLKVKFDVSQGSDEWLLQSFGKKVRNWRGRVKNDYYDPSLSFQEQLNSKPNRVHKDQWRKLVKSWNKQKTKRVSEKNKVNRSKKKMVQVTGKKSYARVRAELKASKGREPSRMELFGACFSKNGTTKNVEAANAIEQMKELSSQLPEGFIDEPGPQDIYSKVMGEDQNGLANMYGLGVRANDVWGVIPSRSACRRENQQWKTRCEQLSNEVVELRALVLEKLGSSENCPSGSNVHVTTPPRSTVANEPPPLRVGVPVYLKNILNPMENVAKGRIKSLDPNEIVGGEEIGPNWCEVNVQVAIKRDERLVRPYDFITMVGDAVGATVAWPCPFVSVVPEDDA